jgi:hypothetical protein
MPSCLGDGCDKFGTLVYFAHAGFTNLNKNTATNINICKRGKKKIIIIIKYEIYTKYVWARFKFA